jgi:hypothetical protein
MSGVNIVSTVAPNKTTVDARWLAMVGGWARPLIGCDRCDRPHIKWAVTAADPLVNFVLPHALHQGYVIHRVFLFA